MPAICRVVFSHDSVHVIAVPYVLVYLAVGVSGGEPVGCRMIGILVRDASHGSVQEIEQPQRSGEMRNNAGEKSEQPVAGQ